MGSHILATSAVLLAMLSGAQETKAQNNLPPPPQEFVEKPEPMDPAALQQQRFQHSVAQAVIRLEANGDRTMEAIEN